VIVARPPLKVRLSNDDFNPFNGSSPGGRHEGAQAVLATNASGSPVTGPRGAYVRDGSSGLVYVNGRPWTM
jgi:hypothetical protein